MERDDLFDRIPTLRPINRVPSLTTINGCGFRLMGRRDFDPPSDTYVKTLWFCLLFVPLVPVAAYRIAESPRGFYFIGREPMSLGAKLVPVGLIAALVLAAAAVVGIVYINSAPYQAQRAIAAGDAAAAAGHWSDAADSYRNAALLDANRFDDAAGKVDRLLMGPAAAAPLADVANLFTVAADLSHRRPASYPATEIVKAALDRVNRDGPAEPIAALAVLDAVKPVVPDNAADYDAARFAMLKAAVKAKPGDLGLAVDLAQMYEARKDLAAAGALLTPLSKQLGSTEGARILGQYLADRGDFDGAYALLEPYTTARLDALHAAEGRLSRAMQSAWDQQIQELNEHKGPSDFYSRYEAATSKDEKEQIVDDYVSNAIKGDSAANAARDELRKQAGVVPVALDLGIVMLRRAQSMADADARRRELEAAEKMFIAVRGVAGQSDQYRLFLGQVYFWLGKHAEGQKLIDEYLTAKNRDFESLVTVGEVYRELGDYARARVVIEEAYNASSDVRQKQDAANLRSASFTDYDDEVLWLSRCDTTKPYIKAELSAARGHQALAHGQRDEAARNFREATDEYLALPEAAASLNNAGLAQIALFGCTGDRAAMDQGIALIERAVTLNPSNSIGLENASDLVRSAAEYDLIAKRIDLSLLQMGPRTDMLGFLFDDAASADRAAEQLRTHPASVKAAAYLERALLLAPKNVNLWGQALQLYTMNHDEAATRTLLDRVRAINFDYQEAAKLIKEEMAGKHDAQAMESATANSARYEAVLKAAQTKGDKLTAAVAAGKLVEIRVTMLLVGRQVDWNATVSVAERAYADAPSNGTRNVLEVALLHRAAVTLAQQNADFARFFDQSRRALGATYALPVAFEKWPAVRTLAASNADIARVCDLYEESLKHFPAQGTLVEWALLKDLRPQAAAAIGQSARGYERQRLSNQIELILSPYSMTAALNAAWLATLDGKPDEGRAIIKRCVDAGGTPKL